MFIVFVDYINIPYHARSPYERPLGGSQSAVCYLSAELVKLGHQVVILNHCDVIRIDDGVLCIPFVHFKLLDMSSIDCLILVNESGNGHRFRSMVRDNALILYWGQQACNQRDVFPLRDGVERSAFDAFVFVSDWQKFEIIEHYSVPEARSYVRRNAMSPAFEKLYANFQTIRAHSSDNPVLAYTSTPFRGLDLLVEIFPEIKRRFPNVKLKVFSDMKVYAAYDSSSGDGAYFRLYEQLKAMDGVMFVGTISQSQLAQELSCVDILAYPNTFAETSCIAVIEAMAAGCRVVTTYLGALPETTANFAELVSMGETRQSYIDSYIVALCSVLEEVVQRSSRHYHIQQLQVEFMHNNYTWKMRALEWDLMLRELFSKRIKPSENMAEMMSDGGKVVENILQYLRSMAENSYTVGDYQGARHSLETILALDHSDAIAYNYLGIVHASQGALESAIACFEKSLKLTPDFVDALFNLGNVCKQAGRLDQAEKWYLRASESDGSIADVHNNLGTLYQKEFMLQESIDCFNRALELDQNNPHYLNNLALSEYYQKHFDTAIPLLKKALDISPDYHEARRNLGIVQLHIGLLNDGWQNYESRVFSLGLHPRLLEKLLHSPVSGSRARTALIISEQGAGDTLQFCRYLACLDMDEMNTSVMVSDDLSELLKGSFPCIADRFISDQDDVDICTYDVVIPLLSLPRFLGIDICGYTSTPAYLTADDDKIEYYRSVFFDHEMLKVGIFWQGNRMHCLDKLRSIPLSYFEGFFNLKGVALYSFQKGFGCEQIELIDGHEIVDMGCLFDDFSDTAAALMNIDLLITVDSAVAHLSAALGKQTWILLSQIADWRWGEGSENTVLYPTVRLFRQSSCGNWRDVLGIVASELENIVRVRDEHV